MGEHHEYVFGNLLGLSVDEIAQLEADQIIGAEFVNAGTRALTSYAHPNLKNAHSTTLIALKSPVNLGTVHCA